MVTSGSDEQGWVSVSAFLCHFLIHGEQSPAPNSRYPLVTSLPAPNSVIHLPAPHPPVPHYQITNPHLTPNLIPTMRTKVHPTPGLIPMTRMKILPMSLDEE